MHNPTRGSRSTDLLITTRSSPSRTNHTGTTCGRPSRRVVAHLAVRVPAVTESRYSVSDNGGMTTSGADREFGVGTGTRRSGAGCAFWSALRSRSVRSRSDSGSGPASRIFGTKFGLSVQRGWQPRSEDVVIIDVVFGGQHRGQPGRRRHRGMPTRQQGKHLGSSSACGARCVRRVWD